MIENWMQTVCARLDAIDAKIAALNSTSDTLDDQERRLADRVIHAIVSALGSDTCTSAALLEHHNVALASGMDARELGLFLGKCQRLAYLTPEGYKVERKAARVHGVEQWFVVLVE